MKKIFFLTALFILTGISFGQIDILKKVTKLPLVPDWSPEGTVTTSINDVYPVVPWFGDFTNYGDPQQVSDFNNLGPGYYRTEIQTYCLHAGSYGPTEGTGYLIAPLMGSCSDVIG